MNITGTDNWVCIPTEKGEFGEPIFLAKGSTLTTNYDQIKVLKSLPVDPINSITEKEVYLSLSGKSIDANSLESVTTNALKLGLVAETKSYDSKGVVTTDLSKVVTTKTILTEKIIKEPIK